MDSFCENFFPFSKDHGELVEVVKMLKGKCGMNSDGTWKGDGKGDFKGGSTFDDYPCGNSDTETSWKGSTFDMKGFGKGGENNNASSWTGKKGF